MYVCMKSDKFIVFILMKGVRLSEYDTRELDTLSSAVNLCFKIDKNV